MHLPSIAVNKSANMKSVKKTPLFFLVSQFLFIISKSSVSGSDPDTKLPNDTQDKTKPWIHFRDSTPKLRIIRAIIEKADEKLYQDQVNSEGIYDRKQIENIESIFQSLAYENDNQMTNLFDSAEAKANMQAVFGYSTSELEQNNKSNRLNTADKGFIDNLLLMARIADIFGPPPTDLNNPQIKRNIHEKKYQGSLQAAIYSNFGPEVPNPSDTRDGDRKSTMEDDGDTADNSGLHIRYPPLSEMEKKYAEDHETTSTTQDSNPAQTPPHSRHISWSRPDLDIYLIPIYPDSSGSTTSEKYNSGNWASSSPKTPDVPIPPPTSSTAPSPNGASAPKDYSMLFSSCLYCFWLMAAIVASL